MFLVDFTVVRPKYTNIFVVGEFFFPKNGREFFVRVWTITAGPQMYIIILHPKMSSENKMIKLAAAALAYT